MRSCCHGHPRIVVVVAAGYRRHHSAGDAHRSAAATGGRGDVGRRRGGCPCRAAGYRAIGRRCVRGCVHSGRRRHPRRRRLAKRTICAAPRDGRLRRHLRDLHAGLPLNAVHRHQLVAVAVVDTALLVVVLIFTRLIGQLAGLDRGDGIVLLFCGSKTSLGSGLPMALVVFPADSRGNHVGADDLPSDTAGGVLGDRERFSRDQLPA